MFDKHLDVKGVCALYASPRLRGSEKGLRVYYDFDFDVSPGGANPVREIWNRARVEGNNAAAGLGGSAKLVLLRGDYKLVKSCKAPNAGADTLAALMVDFLCYVWQALACVRIDSAWCRMNLGTIDIYVRNHLLRFLFCISTGARRIWMQVSRVHGQQVGGMCHAVSSRRHSRPSSDNHTVGPLQ